METSLAQDISSGAEIPAGEASRGAEDVFESWTSWDGGIDNQYHKKLHGHEIVDLIGKEETEKIIDYFHEKFGELAVIDSLYLVRNGLPQDGYYDVHWHKDWYSTMEITLNDNYEGGHVLHLNADGVHKINARTGTATGKIWMYCVLCNLVKFSHHNH